MKRQRGSVMNLKLKSSRKNRVRVSKDIRLILKDLRLRRGRYRESIISRLKE